MRKLKFLIREVRESTDTLDSNSITDKEIIRYFNDALKEVQAIAFDKDVHCAFFQRNMLISENPFGKSFDLPDDCYGGNAVTYVEARTQSEKYYMMDRVTPEDSQSFTGWFTRDNKIEFSGTQRDEASNVRVWYFKRLPRADKVWGILGAGVGADDNKTFTPTQYDKEIVLFDDVVTVLRGTSVVGVFPIVSSTDTTISLDITGEVFDGTEVIISGRDAVLDIDLPVDIEPYLISYVCQRVFTRGTYNQEKDASDYFTIGQRINITKIFSNAGKSVFRPPILDTDYLEI